VTSFRRRYTASSYLPLAAGTYQVRVVPADNNVGGAPLRAFVISDQ
jgi:hypothetical protein